MRKVFLIMPIMLLIVPAYAAEKEQARQEIGRFLDAWHEAAAKADEAAYFAAMAEDFVFLGTDASERWTKAEFRKWAQPAFRRPSAWIFRAVRRSIALAADGNTAWFDEDLDSASFWTSRGSGVLHKEKGNWQLQQYVLSFTIPNESVREIKPIVQKALAAQAGEKHPVE